MSRGRDKFRKFEKAIRTLTCIYGVFPRSIQIRLLDRNRNTKGYIGLAKRYALLKNLAQHVGENVSIKENVYLYNVEGLSIGDNVSIWPMSYIDAFGGVDIGNDVSMAEGTSIFSFNHSTDDLETSIKNQPVKKLPVKVEDNVWIGSKATVLGGVTVGSGSVIAAGAVVNRDVPRNMIMGGIPAKVLKERK